MPPTQLYLISPASFDLKPFAKTLSDVLATGHVAVFQLRMKEQAEKAVLEAAQTLMPICHQHNVMFILNDYIDLAYKINADGVHVGEEKDGTYAEARRLLGPKKTVGISCYGSTDRALDFAEKGADYVAFGAFYPTQTKEPKARPTPDILTWWTTNCTTPCVAIGGITADNCTPLVKNGADFIAVVSAVWNHPQGAVAGARALHQAICA